jgi:hypothetical protein
MYGIWYENDGTCDNFCHAGLSTQGDCEKARLFWDKVEKKCVQPLR